MLSPPRAIFLKISKQNKKIQNESLPRSLVACDPKQLILEETLRPIQAMTSKIQTVQVILIIDTKKFKKIRIIFFKRYTWVKCTHTAEEEWTVYI